MKYFPLDLDRRYDEAVFKVYDHALRMGHRIPKANVNGQSDCLDTPLLGYALGFAFGLQYDFRKQGKCYLNIESSLLALYALYEMIFLIFFPWEWAQLAIAFESFISIVSSLYNNCMI